MYKVCAALLLLATLGFAESARATEFADACVAGLSSDPSIGASPEKIRYVPPLCTCIDTKLPQLEKEHYVLLGKLARLQPDTREYKRLSATIEAHGDQEELDQRVIRSFSAAIVTCAVQM